VCCGWSLLELLFPTPELTSCMQPASQPTERQNSIHSASHTCCCILSHCLSFWSP
jgi:hypothetical protein